MTILFALVVYCQKTADGETGEKLLKIMLFFSNMGVGLNNYDSLANIQSARQWLAIKFFLVQLNACQQKKWFFDVYTEEVFEVIISVDQTGSNVYFFMEKGILCKPYLQWQPKFNKIVEKRLKFQYV